MFTTTEFGPNKTFRSLDEYITALEKLKKLRRLREKIKKAEGKTPDEVSEERIAIDTEFAPVILQAEMKPVSDKLDGMSERIEGLEHEVTELKHIVNRILKAVNNIEDAKKKINKDGIPHGLVLHGRSKGREFNLKVEDDEYIVGDKRFATLSAAAQAVSGNRRSGLTFWKLPDGREVREVKCSTKKE